jgi:hypothetical protein
MNRPVVVTREVTSYHVTEVEIFSLGCPQDVGFFLLMR